MSSILTRTAKNTETPQQEKSEIPQIQILAFGVPEIYINGLQPDWRIARSMELCFYLLHKKCIASKDDIINALWPQSDEQSDNAFYLTIFYLRKAIGKNCIQSMRGIYKLQLSAFFGQNIWYDTHLFAEEYQKAQFFLQNNEYDEAKQALKAMVDLYRGDYLTSIYSDWCRYIREELQRNYIYACLQLAYFAFQEKDFDKCIDYSQRILLYDKYNEDAYYVLISCYAMQGKKRQAYNYYLQCKQTLQEDLDIEPLGSIKSLYHKYIINNEIYIPNQITVPYRIQYMESKSNNNRPMNIRAVSNLKK